MLFEHLKIYHSLLHIVSIYLSIYHQGCPSPLLQSEIQKHETGEEYTQGHGAGQWHSWVMLLALELHHPEWQPPAA